MRGTFSSNYLESGRWTKSENPVTPWIIIILRRILLYEESKKIHKELHQKQALNIYIEVTRTFPKPVT
jgi:hypothetical protein